jgi:hypothetical protein
MMCGTLCGFLTYFVRFFGRLLPTRSADAGCGVTRSVTSNIRPGTKV